MTMTVQAGESATNDIAAAMAPIGVDVINKMIKDHKVDTNQISDGYHTFSELYDHRITLFLALCRLMSITPTWTVYYNVWKSKLHADGSGYDGWFIMGINNVLDGTQISYHLPIDRWDEAWFASEFHTAPKWDGHTPADVITRLKNLI